jgi:hypothetical protein
MTFPSDDVMQQSLLKKSKQEELKKPILLPFLAIPGISKNKT